MTTTTERLPRTRNGNLKGNTDAVIDYWVERLLTRAPGYDHQERNSMSYVGDDLRHYRHWTLAHGLRDARGRTRLVLINGDRWNGPGGFGPSTESRRASAEHAVRRAGLPYLIVPFSALDAAGVITDSIRVLEMLAETWSVSHQSYRAANLDRVWDLERHEDGSMSVRDDRHGYHANVRAPVEIIEHSNWTEYRVPRFRHWLGESVFSADVHERGEGRRRRAVKFLSAFDHNEARECYFLCELPRTAARTVEEAFEALAPAPVKAAQAAGLDVRRQGDIFAIPTSLTTRELKSRAAEQTTTRYEHVADSMWAEVPTELRHAAVWEHVPYPVKSLRMAPLLATNHVATEQVRTVDGDVYARGLLYHRPDFRQPDHARIKLGDGRTWYRIVKNTVPVANSRTANTPMFNVQQSGQSRAWTLGGAVD